jgi:hypothetical protein
MNPPHVNWQDGAAASRQDQRGCLPRPRADENAAPRRRSPAPRRRNARGRRRRARAAPLGPFARTRESGGRAAAGPLAGGADNGRRFVADGPSAMGRPRAA